MPAEDILNEPLFFNQQISVPLGSSATGSADDSTTSRPLTPHDQPSMLAAGITKVAHLQVALKQQHPPAFAACLQSMLMTMPPSWQAVVVAAPTAPTFFFFFFFGLQDSCLFLSSSYGSYLAARPFRIRQPTHSEHPDWSMSLTYVPWSIATVQCSSCFSCSPCACHLLGPF